MGAGLTYAEMYQDEVALKVAAVTKLIRNLFLAAVIPGLTYLNAKQVAAAAGGKGAAHGRYQRQGIIVVESFLF